MVRPAASITTPPTLILPVAPTPTPPPTLARYDHRGQPDEATAFWARMAAWVRSHYPRAPFVISETGAGGIFEWSHNATKAPWTTAYQVMPISPQLL